MFCIAACVKKSRMKVLEKRLKTAISFYCVLMQVRVRGEERDRVRVGVGGVGDPGETKGAVGHRLGDVWQGPDKRKGEVVVTEANLIGKGWKIEGEDTKQEGWDTSSWVSLGRGRQWLEKYIHGTT